MDVCNVTVLGRAGKDAEKRMAGQTPVTGFSLASTTGFGEKKGTAWFDVSVWGKAAEFAAGVKKGNQVLVIGKLSFYDGKDGKRYAKVDADSMILLEKKAEGGEEAQPF